MYRYVQFPATFTYVFVDPPRPIRAYFAAYSLIQNGRIALDPAPDGDVVNREVPLGHDLLQIAKAARCGSTVLILGGTASEYLRNDDKVLEIVREFDRAGTCYRHVSCEAEQAGATFIDERRS